MIRLVRFTSFCSMLMFVGVFWGGGGGREVIPVEDLENGLEYCRSYYT